MKYFLIISAFSFSLASFAMQNTITVRTGNSEIEVRETHLNANDIRTIYRKVGNQERHHHFLQGINCEERNDFNGAMEHYLQAFQVNDAYALKLILDVQAKMAKTK